MENRVYAQDLETFAALCAEFQRQGLAFTAQVSGDKGRPCYFIDITGY